MERAEKIIEVENRSKEEIIEENEYLKAENRKLVEENEKIRDIFRIAIVEFEKRNKEIETLKEVVEKAYLRINALLEENEKLRERLGEEISKVKLLNKIVFGKKSEKQRQQEECSKQDKRRGGVVGHKGSGRKIPDGLPVREEIIDIPEQDRYCPNCGLPYEEIGTEEVSSEVCVEKVYYVKKIKRKKYRKTCKCSGQIITAPVGIKIIPKGKFSLDFWVDVLVNKYKNHLPIERQISEMKEYGLGISAGSIFGGLQKIYFVYLKPLYEEMGRSLREFNHWHADESGWHLFIKIDNKENYNWFIWAYATKDIVFFVLHPTRSAKVPLKSLFDIEPEEIKVLQKNNVNPENKKMLSVDKFSAYKVLERSGFVELSYCWAHQRREFIDAKIKNPDTACWADEWIERIGNLYHINNQRIKYNSDDVLFKEYDIKLREEISGIYALINMEYDNHRQNTIMKSMREHWKGLTLFVDNPEIPMDNNLVERMIRPITLGRKNYWGNHSFWAGELTVGMLSIIQTCKIHNISPRAYLTYYLTECTKKGNCPSENELEDFLPHKLNEDMKIKLRKCS